jgi:hypothetical protein
MRSVSQGSRRGPVNEPAATRNDPVACERKHAALGLDRCDAAGQRTRPSHLAKVGVAGSNPVVRSIPDLQERGQDTRARGSLPRLCLSPVYVPRGRRADIGPSEARSAASLHLSRLQAVAAAKTCDGGQGDAKSEGGSHGGGTEGRAVVPGDDAQRHRRRREEDSSPRIASLDTSAWTIP